MQHVDAFRVIMCLSCYYCIFLCFANTFFLLFYLVYISKFNLTSIARPTGKDVFPPPNSQEQKIHKQLAGCKHDLYL